MLLCNHVSSFSALSRHSQAVLGNMVKNWGKVLSSYQKCIKSPSMSGFSVTHQALCWQLATLKDDDDVPDLKSPSGSSRDPDIFKTMCGIQKQLKAWEICDCTGDPRLAASREEKRRRQLGGERFQTEGALQGKKMNFCFTFTFAPLN